MSRSPWLTVSILLALAMPPAFTQTPAGEPARTAAFNDAQLKWGPCPSFMPAGCEIAVLHGDPSKANADVLIRVPGDSAIPRHWHTSAERIVLLAGEMQVTYDGQPPMTLWPGHYAYGPAKRPHQAHCAKGESCVLFVAFESAVDAVPAEGDVK